MPITFLGPDAKIATLDLKELGKKLKNTPLKDPPEAKPPYKPGRPAARIVLPWTYHLDYGWTPERERLEPRPPLNLPPYYNERFAFRTGGLKAATSTAISIDLRVFPRKSRVFVRVPASILRPAQHAALLAGQTRQPDGAWATVPATSDDYNRLFGLQEKTMVTKDHVIVELTPRRSALLDQLHFDGKASVEVEVRYAVSRAGIRPKSCYVIGFAQRVDGFRVAEFEHVFQAYHPYDIPIVGDYRTMLAYRRSSREVSAIPPLALAFFDSWEFAKGCGFDPAPRSFAKHFTPADVSGALQARILEFVNAPATGADILRQRVVDNAYVDGKGAAMPEPKQKIGLASPTAANIIAARDALPGKKFTRLEEIDAVKGVGPDTLSDLITSFLMARGDETRWYPDEDLASLLGE